MFFSPEEFHSLMEGRCVPFTRAVNLNPDWEPGLLSSGLLSVPHWERTTACSTTIFINMRWWRLLATCASLFLVTPSLSLLHTHSKPYAFWSINERGLCLLALRVWGCGEGSAETKQTGLLLPKGESGAPCRCCHSGTVLWDAVTFPLGGCGT